MLEQHLVSMGLTKDEINIYLELIEIGSASAGTISRKMNIPRSTTYNHLEKLIQKSFINQTVKRGTKIFFPESPENVIAIYKQKNEQLLKSIEGYKEASPYIEQKLAKKILKPKMKIYEKQEGAQQLMTDNSFTKDSCTSIFWPIKNMMEHISADFLREFNINRIKNNTHVRSIFPEDALIDFAKHPYLASGEKLRREIRLFPSGRNYPLGYAIYTNKVSFVSSIKEGVGFTIESLDLAETMLTQFNYMWEQLEPLEIDLPEIDKFIEDNNI